MKINSLTEQIHLKLETRLTVGDVVIDATAGNGHDTLFLSQQVGDTGKVYAFDIQQKAIDSARNRLEAEGLLHQVEWVCTGHESMKQYIFPEYHGEISAVLFNLGYLPGSDKKLITKTETTQTALQQAYELLKPSGILSVMAYPGHSGGDRETESVKSWFDDLSDNSYQLTIPNSQKNNAPRWFWLVK